MDKKGLMIVKSSLLNHHHSAKSFLVMGQTGQSIDLVLRKVLKESNRSADADNGQQRTDADTDQMTLQKESDADRNGDIEEVKTVFGRSHALIGTVSERLYHAVSRIRDKTHGK